MTIPVIMNGEQTFFEAAADEKLLDVLRKNGNLSVKSGCVQGSCGSCTVLLDGKPIPSCLLPVSFAHNRNIETLEHFSKSEEYRCIIDGFEKAGICLCGFCNAGKIFAAHTALRSNAKPTRAAIAGIIRGLPPCCTDSETLINGIIYAFDCYAQKAEVMR